MKIKLQNKNQSKGNMLAMAIAISLLIVLCLLPMVFRLRQNAVGNVKSISKERGSMLAREAIERGIWQVTSSTCIIQQINKGIKISGYDGQTWYSDAVTFTERQMSFYTGMGTYSVDIASGPGNGQIKIVGIGKPNNQLVMAKVTAIYEDSSLKSAVYVESDENIVDWTHPSTLDFQGVSGKNWSLPVTDVPQVHWGRMVSLRGIDVTNGPQFPTKYAKNRVIDRDNGSSTFNSDKMEYWANSNDLNVPPQFDLALMKTQAQNANLYSNEVSSVPVAIDVTLPATYYYQGDLRINAKTNYRGIIIVMGNLFIEASAQSGNPAVTLPVPYDADLEYARYTHDVGGYPADSFLSSNPKPLRWLMNMNTLGMRGFVYVNGNVTVDAVSPSQYGIYGSLYVKGMMQVNPTANFKIYDGPFQNPSNQNIWFTSELLQPPAILRGAWSVVSWTEEL